MSFVGNLQKLLGKAVSPVAKVVQGDAALATKVIAQLDPNDGGLTFNRPKYVSPQLPAGPKTNDTYRRDIPLMVSPTQFQSNRMNYQNFDGSPIDSVGRYPILHGPGVSDNGNFTSLGAYKAVPLPQPNFQSFKKLTRIE